MAKAKTQRSAQARETASAKYKASNEFAVVVKHSGAQYVTLCLELGVVGCGDSLESALADTRQAIESYMEAMEAESLSPWRAVPVQVLHEFLAGEGTETPATSPTLKILAYA
jgi:predicted RNase H-like HicB family nuclease